ncbi:peptide chain release factor N(5)-glutamine methyltransferase [Jannaschia formosa]|uniref:peptide chain release factor N(5)-glutamine methyltransferase n=1 Tax=Jannaschia formosa TaxID=2259592 RepID=UPI000E1B62C1|nr:peptide chain release factor N(5)-glutamine methyltransferase [Jannaschia formosa]TFL17880.1 peptide chain release factor N(5)-glutamine methyltransferase [Jannaschia formosa]
MSDALARLRAAGVPDPEGDLRRLRRAFDGAGLDEAVARRAAREPVSHILGRRAFWAHEFEVTPDVLDPRPETETLVEAALEGELTTVLDLGTGSGCILLSLLAARPEAQGLGTDISEAALAVARRNAEALGLAARATFRRADWLSGIDGAFDLIVSNPPYIAAAEMAGLSPEVLREPHAALTPGGDGLDAYRVIARDAPARLAPGGRLMVEIGPTQADPVQDLFRQAGLADLRVQTDLDGRNRVVCGKIPRQAHYSTCIRPFRHP